MATTYRLPWTVAKSALTDHGFDVGMNDPLELIGHMYKTWGIIRHRWQGDGLSNCVRFLVPVDRLIAAIKMRDTKTGYMNKVYHWTIDLPLAIAKSIRPTNQPYAALHHDLSVMAESSSPAQAEPQAESQTVPVAEPLVQATVQAVPQAVSKSEPLAATAPTSGIEPVVKEKTFRAAVVEFLAIAVAAALFFVVLVVALKHRKLTSLDSDRETLCTSETCDQLAGALVSSLDPTSDPCDDFYAFVCGQYTGVQSTGTVFGDMQVELWRRVKDVIATAPQTAVVPPSKPSVLQKFQALYVACLRPPVSDSKTTLKTFLDSHGLGFPGSATSTDAVVIMLRLSYLYDVQSVLSASFLVANSQPQKVLLFRATVNERYVSWLTNLPGNVDFGYRVLLGVYGDVKYDEDIVQRVRRTESAVLALVKSMNAPGLSNAQLIAEDKDLRYYGNASVKSLVSSLKTTLKAEELHLLVSWDVVRTMAPLISVATVPGEGGTPYTRCWRAIEHSIKATAVAAYLQDSLVPKTTEVASSMTALLRNTYNKLFNNPTFFWSALNKSVVSEFQELQARPLFFTADVQSSQQLEAFYAAYPYEREHSNFLRYWLKTCDLAAEAQRKTIGLHIKALIPPNALSLTPSNKILLPASTLQLPLLSIDGLTSANYAGLGHMLAHAMLHKLHYGLFAAGSRSSSLLAQYRTHIECLQASSNSSSGSSFPAGSEADAGEDWTVRFGDIADLVGLHVAYETFATRKQRRTLPTSNMTETQVFFALSCFKFCVKPATIDGSEPNSDQQTAASRMPVPSSERCNAPLRHLKAFADAFKCKPSSRMNPDRKCTFW
ncbi:endothelin-converting enzyme 1-like [Amblyomma americanum]